LANRRTTSAGRPASSGAAHIRPDSTGFLYLTPEGVAKDFAQDLPAAQTKVMAVTQGPIFAKAFDEKLTKAAWKSKPSWFIVAENDRMIRRPRARHGDEDQRQDHCAADKPCTDAVAPQRCGGGHRGRRRGGQMTQ